MKFKVFHFAPLFLLFFIACQQSGANQPQSSPKDQQVVTIDKKTLAVDHDPVCEMALEQNVEDTVHYSGKVYGFCGPNCKEIFQANPAKYIGK